MPAQTVKIVPKNDAMRLVVGANGRRLREDTYFLPPPKNVTVTIRDAPEHGRGYVKLIIVKGCVC